MKAVVTKENFKKILNIVSHIVGHAASLPILSNILLQTEKGRIKISATNLEIGLTAWRGGRVEEDGRLTLPAKTINDYIATTLGDQISLETEKNNLIISTDSSRATIKTLPADEFPLIPQVVPTGMVSIDSAELRMALSEVIFAAAPFETQPELSGVYTYLSGETLYFVSTDRYRLTERSIKLGSIDIENDFKAITIPHRTVLEVIRLLSGLAEGSAKTALVQGENQVLFRLPDLELVSRLVDGQFPDYKQIIPNDFASTAVLPRYELVQAIKSAGLFASSGKSIKLDFKPNEGQVLVYAASGDIGESTVKIAGEVSGREQQSTFNYRYLIDYLNNISDDKVIFKAINDSSPAVLTPKDRQNNLYLVMPVKA